MIPRSPVVVIAGAGFSGVCVAAHMARLPWAGPAEVVLIERNGGIARGTAYSTTHPKHLLNVPAGRMGVFADDEGHFLRWLRSSAPSLPGNAFVPRSRYGDYLESILTALRNDGANGLRVDVRRDEVRDVEGAGNRLRVRLASGDAIEADRVVLATGTPAPSRFTSDAVRDDPRYFGDPWASGALEGVRSSQPILILGTGLTMVDVVLAVRESGHRAGFVAVSRRGLLPQSHRDWPLYPPVVPPPAGLSDWTGSASVLLALLRDSVRHAEREGLDWRDVVNGLRPVTPSLWQRMPQRERSRFLRHLRPFWDTHRHRMSTRVAAEINSMIFNRELKALAGCIESVRPTADAIEVSIRRRGGTTAAIHHVGAVINATGPESDYARLAEPLFAALCRRGLATPDALGLGISTDARGALLDARGVPSAHIFTLGNPRKADLWESTAVPELRAQAADLAEHLHESLRTNSGAA